MLFKQKYDVIWFLNVELGDKIRGIENIRLRIEDVASFFECRQLLDPDTGLRHSTIIAINKLEEVHLQLQIGGFPRLRKYLSNRGYQKHEEAVY